MRQGRVSDVWKSGSAPFNADLEIEESLDLFKDRQMERLLRALHARRQGLAEEQLGTLMFGWKEETYRKTVRRALEKSVVEREKDRIRLTDLGERRLEVIDIVREAVRDVYLNPGQ